MTLPTAIVTIRIEGITGIRAGALDGAQHAYALATIGGRLLGRSRPIPAGATEFDFGLEAIDWEHEVTAFDDPIRVTVELWDDRGDLVPLQLARTSATISAPYTSEKHQLGVLPVIVCAVEVRLVPPGNPTVPVPRAASGTTSHATLRLTDSIVVEFAEIQGLFAPLNEGGSGIARSEAREGYASEDDRGRVYLNQALDGKWTKDTQLIRLRAKLTVARGALPADARVRWTVGEADDPTNDDPGFHRQWGRYVDEKDYDVVGDHHGATGGDNEGTPDRSAPWEADPAFALVEIKNAQEATTAVVGGESGVLLHCSNTAGDNFTVRAELVTGSKAEGFAATTGVITMWHRVNVAYFRMRSAFELPIADVPQFFELACAQLDFVSMPLIRDVPFMAPGRNAEDGPADRFIEHLFDNKKKPGWFCMIAAMEAYPAPPAGAEALIFQGLLAPIPDEEVPSELFNKHEYPNEFLEVPSTVANADKAWFTTSSGEEVEFGLGGGQPVLGASTPTVRYTIFPYDHQPDFSHLDGSADQAYKIRYLYSPGFRSQLVDDQFTERVAGGYGISGEVQCRVTSGAAPVTDGVSPVITIKMSTGAKDFFAGRTMIFTHHRRYRVAGPIPHVPVSDFARMVLEVMTHELGHAFGTPHKCGYFDTRTPRHATCCMNYTRHWMSDELHDLIPGTKGLQVADLCGRHIKEIRRVHLEDNLGLGWK